MSYNEINEERHYIFGQGGGKKVADELVVEVLAELPIVPAENSIYSQSEIAGMQYLALANKILKLTK